MDRTQRDPFAVDPLPRAHYHPSPEKRLTQNQKQTAISPSRQPEERVSKNVEDNRLSPMDEIFLRNTNSFQPKMTLQYHDADDNDEKFDESWPSSERPSSMNLTGLEEESPMNLERFKATIDKFTDLKKTLSFPEHESPGTSPQIPRKAAQRVKLKDPGKKADKKIDVQSKSQIPVRDKKKGKEIAGEQENKDGTSVLQRYIERFRNSAPLSREERERQKETTSKDFWWLSSSPPTAPRPSSSSILKEEDSREKQAHQVTPLTTVNLDKYSNLQKLRRSGYQQKPADIPPSPGEKKTRDLQARAEKLLERSSSSVVSTEPAVSTDGLGSNTSGMSSFDEFSYRPKFAQFLDKEDQPKYAANPYTYKTDIPPKRVSQPRPEDDPLHQWRLRRRMEQAQEEAPKNVQSFGFLSKTDQQKKIDNQLEDFKRKLAGKDACSRTPKPSYHFTPAPPQEQIPKDDEPHIASPTLHRRKQKTDQDSEVDPHLHLMCDLLPCPHRGKYDELLENLHSEKTSKEVQSDKVQDKVKQTEFLSPRETYDTGNEKLINHVDNKVRENEFISDDERSGKDKPRKDESKYKLFLEAEKPDIESRSDSDRSAKSDRNRKRKEKEVTAEQQNITSGVRQSDTEDIDTDDRKFRSEKKPELDTGAVFSEKKDQDSESDSDNIQRSRGERSRPREMKKEKLRPRLSSSPKAERKVVDDAIGQVVKNHLFSMSTSTVLSSVESLPPTTSVEGLPRVPEQTAEEQSTKEEGRAEMEEKNDEEDSYYSDGEFQEDHLLQMLRKQREQYEIQLREIDAALSSLEKR